MLSYERHRGLIYETEANVRIDRNHTRPGRQEHFPQERDPRLHRRGGYPRPRFLKKRGLHLDRHLPPGNGRLDRRGAGSGGSPPQAGAAGPGNRSPRPRKTAECARRREQRDHRPPSGRHSRRAGIRQRHHRRSLPVEASDAADHDFSGNDGNFGGIPGRQRLPAPAHPGRLSESRPLPQPHRLCPG